MLYGEEIKELRERTGSAISDCKKALVETNGDMEKAGEWLRKKNLSVSGLSAGRIAAEGRVFSYVHSDGRIAVIVEVNCETDFVAKNEDFLAFGKEVALQIAAMNPLFVAAEEIPAGMIECEKAIYTEKAKTAGKPEPIIAKMVDGQLAKWKREVVLLDQVWVKDDKKTIEQLRQEVVGKIRENIKIRRFYRLKVGEGIEKKQDNFVEEVRKQAGV